MLPAAGGWTFFAGLAVPDEVFVGAVAPIGLQGRTLSGEDLAELRAWIAQRPDWHRTAISRQRCARWNWRNAAGRLKDMAARSLLLKLQARGLIVLPPPRTRTGRPRAHAPPPPSP